MDLTKEKIKEAHELLHDGLPLSAVIYFLDINSKQVAQLDYSRTVSL
ncbi:MAG: hypothetical protein ACJA0H_000982 [Francisellaceae bacterium]|jgi:hypothetical protein